MDKLCHQEERRTTSIAWPLDVDTRLNVLVRLAALAGERTSRVEILAAMVSAAETDPEALTRLLHSYRQLSADALTEDNRRSDLPSIRTSGRRRSAKRP